MEDDYTRLNKARGGDNIGQRLYSPLRSLKKNKAVSLTIGLYFAEPPTKKEGYLKNYRHGDLAVIGINELPAGLVASESKVLMTGSGGNDHIVENGIFYPKVEGAFIIGYLEADKGCRLLHPDHGEKTMGSKTRIASVNVGAYQLRRQEEDTHEGMKEVQD